MTRGTTFCFLTNMSLSPPFFMQYTRPGIVNTYSKHSLVVLHGFPARHSVLVIKKAKNANISRMSFPPNLKEPEFKYYTTNYGFGKIHKEEVYKRKSKLRTFHKLCRFYGVYLKCCIFYAFLVQSPDIMKNEKETTQQVEFAIIETGGKQYMVCVGDVLEVELLGDMKEGDSIEFDKVLMVDNGSDTTIGAPYIAGAKVKATYQKEKKGEKIHIVRYKAKSNRDRRIGHRQKYAQVKIEALK